jgi:hypothetical protein
MTGMNEQHGSGKSQQGEQTMTANTAMHEGRVGRNFYRMTARVVGLVYVAGFVVGIGGEMLVQPLLGGPDRLAAVSAASMTVAIGAILWLMAVIGDAAHGVLMYPILKRYNERIAVGYLAARIMDAVFIAIMVLLILFQIPLANEYVKAAASDSLALQALSTVLLHAKQYAYQVGMSTLGVSGLMLCYTLYRARLIPRVLAMWGLVGYGIILIGMLAEIAGLGLGVELASSLPGGLWEVFIGVWLLVKGFSSSPVPQERTSSSTITRMTSPDVGSATT